MKVALHGTRLNSEALPFLKALIEYLRKKKIAYLIYEPFADFLDKRGFENDLLANCEYYTTKNSYGDVQYFLSIGGDGTILDTVRIIGEKEIPILGLNAGRLGFLSSVSLENFQPAIDSLINRDYTIEKRSLLALQSNRNIFENERYALNEFTVVKRDTSSMITVKAYLDGSFLNSYWGDGLIVATPSGSTGYSLSCGGPIVMPNSENFIITPISPHNLYVRPLIVPSTSELKFEVESRSKSILVSMDSRSVKVDKKVSLTISSANFKVHFISLNRENFIQTLKHKLNWGLDNRN